MENAKAKKAQVAALYDGQNIALMVKFSGKKYAGAFELFPSLGYNLISSIGIDQ